MLLTSIVMLLTSTTKLLTSNMMLITSVMMLLTSILRFLTSIVMLLTSILMLLTSILMLLTSIMMLLVSIVMLLASNMMLLTSFVKLKWVALYRDVLSEYHDTFVKNIGISVKSITLFVSIWWYTPFSTDFYSSFLCCTVTPLSQVRGWLESCYHVYPLVEGRTVT